MTAQGGARNEPDAAPGEHESVAAADDVCERCGDVKLYWRNCKLICKNCRTIVKSCADL
jgi:hypothetical protein